MTMKEMKWTKGVILTLFVCGLLFLLPGHTMGARVTGQDTLVSTTETTAAKAEDQTPKPQTTQPARSTQPVPRAKAASGTESKYVTIDFNDVDIRVFIKFISELTGRNFVIDKAVKGKVTIVSPKKISVKEAYKVFESVMEVHGYTAIPAGDIIKIVSVRSARERNVETRLRKQAISPEDKVVTQLIPLDYANPDEMKKVLTPLVSKSSVIISYPPTGMLIVTDLLSNIKRLFKIVTALDIEGIEEQISVISLSYASAAETAKSLTQIFQKKPLKGRVTTSIQIVSDDRTNTIIALASDNDTTRIKKLITLLDKEIPRGEAKVRVYHLQNADAEELTKVLMNIPAKGTQQPEKGKGPVISKDVQVVPDKATNTLVITAERDDYVILADVIRELDVPRPMVYIEAMIMEVNVDKRFKIGAEWTGGEYISTDEGRTKVYGGGFQSGGITPSPNAANVITFPEGFSVGVLGQAIQIGDFTFPNLGAVFQAYQKDEDVKILSTPQILTLDNEEAEIYVGKNVPYQTRAETSDANVDYSSYEYKDVGVTLKITPQISQERFVRLNIYQEVTKLVESGTATERPTTLKRTAKTVVFIKDKNTIVIGGLTGEDVSNTVYKVPCLGNMPLLGWLFKYESQNRENTNLFIFITPHIIENPVEAKALYEKKQEHIDKVEDGIIKMNKRKSEKIEKREVVE